MDCQALLWGIFPTQGLNPGVQHCRKTLYHLNHQGSPFYGKMQKLEVIKILPKVSKGLLVKSTKCLILSFILKPFQGALLGSSAAGYTLAFAELGCEQCCLS